MKLAAKAKATLFLQTFPLKEDKYVFIVTYFSAHLKLTADRSASDRWTSPSSHVCQINAHFKISPVKKHFVVFHRRQTCVNINKHESDPVIEFMLSDNKFNPQKVKNQRWALNRSDSHIDLQLASLALLAPWWRWMKSRTRWFLRSCKQFNYCDIRAAEQTERTFIRTTLNKHLS